jgi:hypothetical protein
MLVVYLDKWNRVTQAEQNADANAAMCMYSTRRPSGKELLTNYDYN